MSNTRASIRQRMAEKLPGAKLATAGSSSTTQLNDTDDEQTLYSGEGGPDYTGYWIVRPNAVAAGDNVRRVASFNADEGYLRPSRAWTNAPTGETYELYPPDMQPVVLNRAINAGLRKLTYLKEETLTITSGDNSYSLTGYTWFFQDRQVVEVYREVAQGDSTMRIEWPWFKVFQGNLRLWPAPHSMTGLSVIVEALAYFSALDTDASTTTCNLDWAAASGLVETYRALRRSTHGQDVTRWREELRAAVSDLRAQSAIHAPRRPRRIMPRSPIIMPRSNYRPRELL